jgi:fibronectin-binding autotransporter adhesin
MLRLFLRLTIWKHGLRKSGAKAAAGRLRDRFRPRVEALEDRLAPATFVWTGQGGNSNFSTAANWSNAATGAAGTPGAGDSLVFPFSTSSPAVTPGTVNNDLTAGTDFASITFLSNGWTITGNTLGITGSINDNTNTAGTNTINADLTFAAAAGSVGINVVNPQSGPTNSLTPNELVLGGTVDLGGAGATTSGVGTLFFNNIVSGTGQLVADGPGTVNLTAADTYSGGTVIDDGIVAVSGSATALGFGTVTVNSGGTLQLGVTGVANDLDLNGFGFNNITGFPGNGALTFSANNLTYVGPITLSSNSSINVGGNTETLAGFMNSTGTLDGPGGLTVVGTNAGKLVDQDAGTYTGVTNVLGPTLTLNSPAAGQSGGKNTGTSGYVVSQGGTLQLDNTTQQTNNRLGTGAFVELDGGNLTFTGTATSESFAALDLGNAGSAGTGPIVGSDVVNLGPSNNTVTVGTINRAVGSTVNFTGTNFGTGNNLTPGAFGAGAGLVHGILPYAYVGTGGGTSFVTDITPGTTPLMVAVPGITINANTATNFSGGTANVLVTGAVTLTLNANSAINSLALAGGATVDLAGHTLTISSGAILTESSTDNITDSVGGGALLFQNSVPAAVEGIIQNAPGTTLTLGNGGSTVPITAGDNLTLAASTLIFNGVSAANSTYTGVTWVTSGKVQLDETTAATVIPTTLVIGDNAGGGDADVVEVSNSAQQLGGAVTVNSSGELLLDSSISQSVGALTLHSGLSSANVDLSSSSTLTVTGKITSSGVVLSPGTGLTGDLPDVNDFKPSLIEGSGTLILASSTGTTTTFDVLRTPAVVDGGEQDLELSATIGAASTSTILDKTGDGTLALFTLPAGGYTGTVQIDKGRFAVAVANFDQPIVVDSGGILGNDSVAGGSTANTVTVNTGGVITPSLGEYPLAEQFTNSGPDDLAGTVALHIGGYGGAGVDSDQLVGSTGGNQVTLGSTSLLVLDLFGLAQNGTLSGSSSPFQWANALIGTFSDAPNATGPNILPAADVLNNPTGFEAIVTYGAGFLTVTLTHPPTVPNSVYTTGANTPLVVGSKAAGVLAGLTDPDFNGIVAQATQDTVANPGRYVGSAGGTLVVNANGTFAYTPAAGFSGVESFVLTAVNPFGALSAPFTVSFVVTPSPVSSALPVVLAFLVPAPSGQVGVGGFVFDPAGIGELHLIVIDWHDGTGTFLAFNPGNNGYIFLPAQFHKKHHGHTIATVYVVDAQVQAELAAGGGYIPHFDVSV